MANTKTKSASTTKTKVVEETNTEDKNIIPKDIDMNQYITVKNGFHGKLVYKSSHTGEKFVWDGFGDEQEMELRELKNARNTNKRFFIDNWFMFDDEWVIDFLGVRKFYKNSIPIDGFDDIFKKTPSDIKKMVAAMSDGQKRSLAYRARDLISSGDIDSRKTIAALEDALGIELIEK